MNDSMELEFAGRRICLIADKAVYLPELATILVADVHLGKAASFRARNFFAPQGIGDFDLKRLSGLLKDFKADRLIILGDMIHAPDGLASDSLDRFAHWRDQVDVEIILVMGNHDFKMKKTERKAILKQWRIRAVEDELVEEPFIFAHDPLLLNEEHADSLRIGGHIHPSILLSGKGKQSERLPCFWLRKNTSLVLPAFGSFTGSYTITPEKDDKVFAVAHDTVIEIKMKK